MFQSRREGESFVIHLTDRVRECDWEDVINTAHEMGWVR